MKVFLPVALCGSAVLAAAAVVTMIPAGAQAAAGTTASASSGAAAYTACVQAHGVADFPGITVASDGRVLINVNGSGSSFDPLSAAYQAASKACASKLPSGTVLPAAPQLSRPPAPQVDVNGLGCSGSVCPKAPDIQGLTAPAAPS